VCGDKALVDLETLLIEHVLYYFDAGGAQLGYSLACY
jgi:hypothetical protein